MMRSFRRSPGFALVAILTLTLGIGVTTAVLSVVDHALLHTLPFREPDRLMSMYEREDRGSFRLPSPPTVGDWQRDAATRQAFDGISYVRGDGQLLREGDDQDRVAVAFVDSEFFPILGATPIAGRALGPSDHAPSAPPVAVLAHWYWQQHFAGDRAVVGRTVNLDGAAATSSASCRPALSRLRVVLARSHSMRIRSLTRRAPTPTDA